MWNKLWVDQGKEFHNNILQGWLDNNDILMYSTGKVYQNFEW